MEDSNPDIQMADDVPVVNSRFNHIGCTGLLLAAMILFLALGVRWGRSEAFSSETGSEIADNQVTENLEEELPEIQEVLATPTISATKPVQAAETPTPTPEPSATPESTVTRSAGSSRSSVQVLPSVTPTPLNPTESLTPLPTETPQQDFTIEFNPTPTENYSSTVKVPILMYHYVSNPPSDADIYRKDLSVTPEDFSEQMLYLVEQGYTTIDLYDLSMAIVNEHPLPDKPVILTFDDGYLDNYQNGYPVLQELGLKATFFIATGFVDDGNPNYMDWEMIEEMSAAGMRFEPHSKTHLDLRDKERAVVIYEILGSQETLAAHTGYLPRYFAYPGGRYDSDVIDILVERDFWGAVTTAVGSWHGFDDRYEWARQRVRFSTNLALFSDLIN